MSPDPSARVDRLMDDASRALVAMRYIDAEALAARALDLAREHALYERMARVLLPLQEARRQRRQLAVDAGLRAIIDAMPTRAESGCFLLRAPLAPRDAWTIRARADRDGAHVLVLALGSGPSAAVTLEAVPPGSEGARARAEVQRWRADPPDVAWFEAGAEALGDAAIASVGAGLPPRARVDALLALLRAHPDHEKLHQRLADACRDAR